MRRLAAAVLLPFLLAGCADYSKAGKDETRLDWMYEAMNQTYPLTKPVIIGCDYYREIGEKERHPIPELVKYNADQRSFDWMTGASDWSDRMCAG